MNLNELFERMKKALNPEQPVQQAATVQKPESKDVPEPESAPEHDEAFDLAVAKDLTARIMMKTTIQALHMELTDQVPGIFGSKVGGLPYLPEDAEVPCDANGNPLQLLAQINCSELSALPDFPQEGLLQFWIGQDESYGLFKDGGARVIYYSQLDSSVTEDSVRAKITSLPKPDESCSPLNGEFGISMAPKFEGLSMQDVHFEPLFVKMYNEDMPEQKITEIYDLGDEVGEYLTDANNGFGHKIGGYPAFTQWDPREENDPRTVLLFQLDSDYGNGITKVMWGDAGIGAFFCSPEALAARDFSDVLYNWDCG